MQKSTLKPTSAKDQFNPEIRLARDLNFSQVLNSTLDFHKNIL